MSGPPVSVVMSVYNGADLLSESVECILDQEGIDLEMIVVNDGSTDATAGILDTYAATDRRVRVFHQENTGLTRALIRGCAEARGSYIARQDCGDISLPDRLARQAQALAVEPRLSFVSCWTEFVGPEREFIRLEQGSGPAPKPCGIIDQESPALVRTGPSCHPSVMFRRSHYEQAGGYQASFHFGQDWDLWYRLAQVGLFQMLEAPLYQARLLPGSVSARNRPRQQELARLAREALQLRLAGNSDEPALAAAARILPEPRGAGAEDSRRAAWLYFIGEGLRRNGDRRALRYFREALREDRFHVKAWLRLLQTLAGRVLTSKKQ